MKKMNKKGFTLIEMLVVIAIIAVLVSIIIPTAMNSTNKAAAASNAANLRSLKAEITTAYLTNDSSVWTFNADGTVTCASSHLPSFKGTDSTVDDDFTATYTNAGVIEVKFENKTIAQWAADAGNAPQVTETTPATNATQATEATPAAE